MFIVITVSFPIAVSMFSILIYENSLWIPYTWKQSLTIYYTELLQQFL